MSRLSSITRMAIARHIASVVILSLNQTRLSPVDNLWITRRDLRSKSVDNSPILDRYLTRSVRSIAISERLRACSSRVHTQLTPVLCLLLGVLAINMQPAQASENDYLKLYAHSRIVNYKEFQCFVSIINKENRSWDIKAKNGSHYGIGQMRSLWYKELDGFRQIDATIKYAITRYGTLCDTWAFHKRKNFY